MLHFLLSRLLPKKLRHTKLLLRPGSVGWFMKITVSVTQDSHDPSYALACNCTVPDTVWTLEHNFSGETTLALPLQSMICTNVINCLKKSKRLWTCTVKPLCGHHGQITVFTYSTCLLKDINRMNWEVLFVIGTQVDFSGKANVSAPHKGPEQCFNIQNYFHMRIPI